MTERDNDILRKFPETFLDSEEIEGLLKTVEAEIEEEILPLFDEGASLINPFEFPIELKSAFSETLQFEVPQLRGQSEEAEREQLSRVFEWVKLKGLEVGLQSYMNSVGFYVDTEHMLSEDYQSFTSYLNLPHIDRNFFNTAHTVVEFAPFKDVDGIFLTDEVFRILTTRLEKLYPITTVPHYRFRVIGHAEDQPRDVFRNNVWGSTTENWKQSSALRLDNCHRLDDGIQLDTAFDVSYLEEIDHWKLFNDERVFNYGESDDQSIDDLTSFSNEIQSGSDFELDLQNENLPKIKVDIREDEIFGESYNSIVFYNSINEPVLAYGFPDVTVFDLDDVFDVIDHRFTGVVENVGRRIQVFLSMTQRVYETDSVRFETLSDYDFSYDEDLSLDSLLELDQQWKLDGDFNVPYLASLRNGGYWKAGKVPNSGSFPYLDSNGDPVNELLQCDDFSLNYTDSLNFLHLTINLVRSPLFNEDFDQIVLYDSTDSPIIAGTFEDVSLSDQQDDVSLRINWELI